MKQPVPRARSPLTVVLEKVSSTLCVDDRSRKMRVLSGARRATTATTSKVKDPREPHDDALTILARGSTTTLDMMAGAGLF
jgi:hypothetical protein